MNLEDIPDAVVNKILSLKSDSPCIVTVKKKPELWLTSKLKRGSTTKQEFPDVLHPDISFENPKKNNVIVKGISLSPNNIFREKGMVKVYVGALPVFENETAGDFTDVTDISIDLQDGLILKRGEKIDVFLLSNDGTIVSMTVQITLGL